MNDKLNLIKNKYKTVPLPVKASIWFAFCNILQKGISMITVPIFTRILTTEQYGVFSVYQSWYSIITVFATLNLYYGVFNNGMIKYSNNRDTFTSTMQGLTTTITGILLVFYLLFPDFCNRFLGLPEILIIAMFAQLFFEPAYSFWASRQRYEYKYRNLVIITLIITIISPLFGFVAVLNTTYKAEARVFSFVLIQVCVGIFFYVKNLWKGKAFFKFEYWKFALAFNIPLIPHYLSQSILQQSDRLMISSMVGTTDAAIYSVAYSVSILMVLVTSAINNSFVPYTYNCLKERKIEQLKKSTNALIVLVGLGTFFVVAFGPEVIKIFAPKEYYDAISIIPPVSASVYFMFLYPLFGNIEFYFEENKFVMLASITGAIVNVILNYIFIPIFGYVAAGYTTLICYMLFSGGHYIFMKKVLKKHNFINNVYDARFIFLFSCVVILAITSMLFVYNNIILRYLLIILIVVLVIFKRNLIINLLKTIKAEG